MTITDGFFYLFSAVLLFSALRVVTAANPVHAALYLVLAFTQASALWMMLQAEFIAITLIVVYVGAVMVLFLFVVMMLDIRIEGTRALFWKNFPLAAALGAVVAAQMVAVLLLGFPQQQAQPVAGSVATLPNTKAIGILMYSEYIFPIQVAALLLLVAMVAAIALTMRKRKDTRTVSVTDQIRVRAQDRMVVVDMPFEALPQHVSQTQEAASKEDAPTAQPPYKPAA